MAKVTDIKTRSQKYWDGRAEWVARRGFATGDALEREMAKLFQESYQDINKEVQAFYAKYGVIQESPTFKTLADGTKVATGTSKKLVVPSSVANKQLAKLTRLEKMEQQLVGTLKAMNTSQKALMADVLGDVASNAYYDQIYATYQGIGVGTSFNVLPETTVRTLISNPVNGGEFPGTPITGCDIDGDGYPSIYVVTYDLNSPYTSCITRLDHEGNILCESEICYKPCWGGISMADADFNGYFEIYLGDRSSSGGPGGSSTPYPDNPARGLSCYNATTLETMWTRPDLMHSTPSPILADVAGDENLEVIGNNIINNGCCVVNAITGEDIYNWKGKQIENHAKSTIYDID